eukprot:2526586-Rhodomonas_salina.1
MGHSLLVQDAPFDQAHPPRTIVPIAPSAFAQQQQQTSGAFHAAQSSSELARERWTHEDSAAIDNVLPEAACVTTSLGGAGGGVGRMGLCAA